MKPLAVCAIAIAVSFGCSSLSTAQSFSQEVVYNFQDPNTIADGATGDDISLDCLAANGYGIWTASSSQVNSLGVSNADALYLLGNRLNSSSTLRQNGIIAVRGLNFGNYPSSDVIKCAANLKGQVRYVYFHRNSGTGTSDEIWIEGFDEQGSSYLHGINARFCASDGTITGGDGLPGTKAQEVVKEDLPTATKKFSLDPNHHLVGPADDPTQNPNERFDVAIDADFLYVVWQEYDALSSTSSIYGMSEGPVVWLGLAGPGSTGTSDDWGPRGAPYGDNRIERGAQSNKLLISSDYTTAVDLTDVSENYWGATGCSYPNDYISPVGRGPSGSDWDQCHTSDVIVSGIDFDAYTVLTGWSGVTAYCSDGLPVPSKKREHTPAVAPAPQLSRCDSLRHDGVAYVDNGQSTLGYTMLQQFIRECAADIHHPSYGWLSLFMKIGGSVSDYASQDHAAYANLQQWLKAVLYTNRDSDYYCADVFQILSTFIDSSGTSTYETQTERLATMRYILDSHRCPALEHDIQISYGYAASSRRKLWEAEAYEKGIDTIASPYDSTLPSIDDIGLGILRGPTQRVSSSTSQSGPSLITVSALNNPFNRDLDLTLHMGREALLTVEMFDLLGNAVPLTGMKYMLKESGPQRVTVPVGSLAAGTYYLRVSTDWGDVKTVKVVKE